MKFSIRDLLLITAAVALAVGWWIDRSRQAAEIERLNKTIAFSKPVLAPGSKEAMAAFISEVENGNFSDLAAATKLCFVPGTLAAPYMPLFAKADKTCAPDNPQIPAGVQFEFWCQSFDAKQFKGSFVRVVATGNPLRIVDAEVVIISPPEDAAP